MLFLLDDVDVLLEALICLLVELAGQEYLYLVDQVLRHVPLWNSALRCLDNRNLLDCHKHHVSQVANVKHTGTHIHSLGHCHRVVHGMYLNLNFC